MNDNTILNPAKIKTVYGSFYNESPKVSLDKDNVPKKLWPLLPYAEFWGLADDGFREGLVQKVSPEVIQSLVVAVSTFDDELDEWLAGPEADDPSPSDEYVAFSAMRMAADFADA